MKLAQIAKISVHCTVAFLTSYLSRFVAEPIFFITKRKQKNSNINLSQVKRVLVIRLDEIGDVVMTTPFLRELRRNLPYAHITLVVKPAIYNLVELCPYVNEILTYNWKVSRYLAPFQRHWRAVLLSYRHIWGHHYDLAIVPRWDTDYYHASFIAYFSGAQWRVGYSEKVNERKKCLNRGFDHLFTHILYDNTLKHEVEHNLDVIRFIGGTVQEDQLELWTSKEDVTFGEQVLKSHNLTSNKVLLIAFVPGAGAPKRMWPLENFVELGMWLKRTYHVRIVVFGGIEDWFMGQKLQAQLGDTVINLVGKTTLRQTSALLKHCQLYVGNDTGSMHLAAAVGVPIIEISCHPVHGSLLHANSPRRFGPWGVRSQVLQPEKAIFPCSDECLAEKAHCILGIQIEDVKKAVMYLLSKQNNSFFLKE